MRFGGLILVCMLPLMVACKILPQMTNQPPLALNGQDGGDDITLTGVESKAADGQVRPKPRPTSPAPDDGGAEVPVVDAQPALDGVAAEPAVQKSKEQIACEKRGGSWAKAGKSNLSSCVTRTRDAGKQCRKQGDCSSVCLARSGTCAPVKPLFGCNEILQKDGSRVTLCID